MSELEQIAQQQANTAQINALLKASADSLLCGPDCQKAKMEEELKNKYLAAGENVKTAPYQLIEAKKNYYVYTKGQYEYDIEEEAELHKNATSYANVLTAKFMDLSNSISTLITNYNIGLVSLNNSATLYKDYKGKNLNMTQKLENNENGTITNNRKSYYENTKYNSLKSWHTTLIVIYYIIFVLFIIGLFINNKLTITNPAFKTNIGMIFIFSIYPWLIQWILFGLMWLITTIRQYIPKNIYNTL